MVLTPVPEVAIRNSGSPTVTVWKDTLAATAERLAVVALERDSAKILCPCARTPFRGALVSPVSKRVEGQLL